MKETIGKKIRKMRLEKRFSQEELAEKLHISRSTLERMENGKSNSWTNQLENLSRIFDVSPEEFVKKESNEQHNENQSGGMSLQNNGKIKTINHLNEKVIELLETRLQENRRDNRTTEKEKLKQSKSDLHDFCIFTNQN